MSATTHAGNATVAEIKPFLCTTVGKKFLMGISGLIWAGFVFGHMAGNMLIFVSKDAYNSYGHAITSGAAIYAIEALLLLALGVHVVTAIMLTYENRKARGGQRYLGKARGDKKSAWASRTMMVHGSIVLVFVITHLSTFKYGTIYSTTVNGVEMRDLARLMVEVFKQPGYVAWYIVSLVLLGFHLKHGIGSTIQSLGIKNHQMESLIPKISLTYGIVVALGFISQPLYILFMLE